MAVLVYRDIVKRIRSSQKTQQITKTMQMVAASRLKKSYEKFTQSKPYLEGIREILSHLQSADVQTHPLLTAREVKTEALVIVTSDRGLCGTYNANLIHCAETFLSQHDGAELIVMGKKGDDYFKKSRTVFKRYLDIAGKTDFEQIRQMTEMLTDAYCSGRFDAIYLAYTVYKSALSIRPAITLLFPIRPNDRTSSGIPSEQRADVKTYLEPSRASILDRLLPAYVAAKIYTSLLEAFTAENSARMIAMKNATDNANEMIRHLMLLRNKARQGMITKELLEMVTASEALRN